MRDGLIFSPEVGQAASFARPGALRVRCDGFPRQHQCPDKLANSCCTPGRRPAILMTATRSVPSSKPLRASPAARSSVPMSTTRPRCRKPTPRLRPNAGSSNARSDGAPQSRRCGYNLRLVPVWLRTIPRAILPALFRPWQSDQPSNRLFNGRLFTAVVVGISQLRWASY